MTEFLASHTNRSIKLDILCDDSEKKLYRAQFPHSNWMSKYKKSLLHNCKLLETAVGKRLFIWSFLHHCITTSSYVLEAFNSAALSTLMKSEQKTIRFSSISPFGRHSACWIGDCVQIVCPCRRLFMTLCSFFPVKLHVNRSQSFIY